MKGFLDKIVEKGTSRKLLVFAIATTLLVFGHLEDSTWMTIAITYLFGQSAIDAVKTFKE